MFFDILHVVLSSMSRTATNSEIQNVSLAYETQKKKQQQRLRKTD